MKLAVEVNQIYTPYCDDWGRCQTPSMKIFVGKRVNAILASKAEQAEGEQDRNREKGKPREKDLVPLDIHPFVIPKPRWIARGSEQWSR